MGGSSSHPYTEQLMSHIHAFLTEDMYSPQNSDSFNTQASFQHITREDSLVEVATPLPQSKPTRGRQKRTAQNEVAPRQTAWTNEEEIMLCKGWVKVSKNNRVGNAMKDVGFWTETVRPNVARFCEVYANVMRRAHESGAGDEDSYAKGLIDYEAEHGMPFTLRHCWEVLKSGDASINLNVDVGDNEEDELAMHNKRAFEMKKEEYFAFLEIKRREVECGERELVLHNYRQRQEHIRFYMQPYDHLTVDALNHLEALRAEIKAK
ncbi:hypothetical protein Tco_0324165 [Tanacetum coccineum]